MRPAGRKARLFSPLLAVFALALLGSVSARADSGLAPADAPATFDKLRYLCLVPGLCPLSDETYDYLKRAVEGGDRAAEYFLGISLVNGDGAPVDRLAGTKWIVISAEQGGPAAARYVENHLQDGENIEADETKVASALRAESDKGNVAAMQVLALMTIRGRGTVQDPDAGWAMLLKSAQLTTGGEGEYQIAELLLVGTNGMPKDHEKAMEWYAKSASRGNVRAMATLGGLWENEPFMDMKELLRTGRIPEQKFKRDVVQSYCWYVRAALMGDALAQYELALDRSRDATDARGNQIRADLLEADYWFRLGARDPEYDNSQVRGLLEPKMTTAQLEEVKKRVAAFRPMSFTEMKTVAIPVAGNSERTCPNMP